MSLRRRASRRAARRPERSGFGGVQLGAETVHEQRLDELQDVPLGCVVGTEIATSAWVVVLVDDVLEEGTEDGGGDA